MQYIIRIILLLQPKPSIDSREESLLSLEFCSVLAELAEKGETTGRSGKRFENIASFSTFNNLHVLRQLHLATKATRTLEVGLAFGGSCLVFTQTHRDLGSSPQRQHVAIDPFQASPWIDDAGLLATERAGLSGYLDFRGAPSCLVLPELLKTDEKFGLVYIDGSHLFEDVFIDFYYIVRILEVGGIVLFDDSADPHVSKVLRFIRKNLAEPLPEFNLAPYRPTENALKYLLASSAGKIQLTAFQRKADPIRKWNSPYRNF